MNKILAITLCVLWITYLIFQNHEYAWILRILLGMNIGSCCVYTWKYYDIIDEILENE